MPAPMMMRLDGLSCIGHGIEDTQHRTAGRGISCDFDPDFRDNSECAFAADEQTSQIEFIASPTGAAELNGLPSELTNSTPNT